MMFELSNICGNVIQSTFTGSLIMDDVLRRFEKKELDAICSYLFSVDKEKSTTSVIGLCFLISCYKDLFVKLSFTMETYLCIY